MNENWISVNEKLPYCTCEGCPRRPTDDETDCSDDLMKDALELLKKQRKTGYWEWKTFDYYRCSECGHETNVDECMEKPIYNYCPYCGAKMLYRKSGYHPQIPHPIDSNTQWT